jgi:hypothetical protein
LGSVQSVYEWTSKGVSAYHVQWTLLRGSEDGLASVDAGHNAVRRSANASWFEWREGSAPLFWNWPERYQREVRDGQPHFMAGTPGPPFLRAQFKHKEPTKHELMRAKVVKVRKLDYISSGEVVSGTHFFSVDKGETDIRMIYNGTSCGLNDILYAPHFGLPTIRETLRAILPGFHQCDLDVQDQFLNFILRTRHRGTRFRRDVACLLELTVSREPPMQLYRAKHVMAFFVIGDASGSGKGVAVVEQYGVEYEAGPWKMQWRKESSNVREAENLTDHIERLGIDTALADHEVFVMTDNTAFEGAYYKGHSPSAKLNNIVFRLHKTERDGGFILHVLHISGKRMKATGVDGLSRGDLTEGMLAGAEPFSFLPFNRGADDRASGAVGSWVRSWWRTKKGKDWGGMPLEEVTPETMFELKDMQAARCGVWHLQ